MYSRMVWKVLNPDHVTLPLAMGPFSAKQGQKIQKNAGVANELFCEISALKDNLAS